MKCVNEGCPCALCPLSEVCAEDFSHDESYAEYESYLLEENEKYLNQLPDEAFVGM